MEIVTVKRHDVTYVVYVTPHDRVEIHTHKNGLLVNVRVFRVGDIAEHDSYNLIYTAKIEKITPKRITFQLGTPDYPRTKSMKYETFAWRNHDFDYEDIVKRNAETSMYI